MNTRILKLSAVLAFMVGISTAQQRQEVVTWSARVASPTAKGEKLTAFLDVKIDSGWHMYALTQPAGGPIKAEISVPDDQAFRAAGPVSGPKPRSFYDPNFHRQTEAYEGDITLQLPLAIKDNAQPGAATGIIIARFQACSARLCLPPTTVRVPLSFTIPKGSTAGKSGAKKSGSK